jgi:hypothetical protein
MKDILAIDPKIRIRMPRLPMPMPRRPKVDRWAGCPPFDMPLVTTIPNQTEAHTFYAVEAVLKLGEPFIGWVMVRSNDYFVGPGRLWGFETQEYQACIDLLRWRSEQQVKAQSRRNP